VAVQEILVLVVLVVHLSAVLAVLRLLVHLHQRILLVVVADVQATEPPMVVLAAQESSTSVTQQTEASPQIHLGAQRTDMELRLVEVPVQLPMVA